MHLAHTLGRRRVMEQVVVGCGNRNKGEEGRMRSGEKWERHENNVAWWDRL